MELLVDELDKILFCIGDAWLYMKERKGLLSSNVQSRTTRRKSHQDTQGRQCNIFPHLLCKATGTAMDSV